MAAIKILKSNGVDYWSGNGWTGQPLLAKWSNQAKANMNIEYDPEHQRFIFDHLSPSEPAFEGVYAYYGPDFTFDSLALKKKLWTLESDIDIKNKE